MLLRRTSLCLLVALLLAAGVAACGGSDDSSEDSSGSASSVSIDEALNTTTGPENVTTTTGARGTPTGKVTYGWHLAVPPLWFDPQESGSSITQFGFTYLVHDSMIKHFPGAQLQPSLAESFEIADDFKSAKFKIRPTAKFHNGQPVTSEDVRFTYESYRGTGRADLQGEDGAHRDARPADVQPLLQGAVPRLPDALRDPGHGHRVDRAEGVLPAGGAGRLTSRTRSAPGPYKLVRNSSNTEFEFEAMADYWRKSPHVKTIVVKVITDDATRFAAMQTGEIDFMNVIQGALLPAAQKTPGFTPGPGVHRAVLSGAPGLGGPLQPLPRRPGPPGDLLRDRPQGDQRRRDRGVLPDRHRATGSPTTSSAPSRRRTSSRSGTSSTSPRRSS